MTPPTHTFSNGYTVEMVTQRSHWVGKYLVCLCGAWNCQDGWHWERFGTKCHACVEHLWVVPEPLMQASALLNVPAPRPALPEMTDTEILDWLEAHPGCEVKHTVTGLICAIYSGNYLLSSSRLISYGSNLRRAVTNAAKRPERIRRYSM